MTAASEARMVPSISVMRRIGVLGTTSVPNGHVAQYGTSELAQVRTHRDFGGLEQVAEVGHAHEDVLFDQRDHAVPADFPRHDLRLNPIHETAFPFIGSM